MMFVGSKHCPRCGAAASARVDAQLAARKCARCRIEVKAVAIGSTSVREGEHCFGFWVAVPWFEKVCSDREEQAAVLGMASPAPGRPVSESNTRISYAPCPECSQLMNRVNVARCSRVGVGICK